MQWFDNLKRNIRNTTNAVAQPIVNAQKSVSDFFAPTEEVRVRDVVRETPGAVVDVAKDIAQGTARSLDFVGRKGLGAIYNPIADATGAEYLRPENQPRNETFDRVILGRDAQKGEKVAQNLGEVGQIEFGVDPTEKPILATILGAGIIGLDMLPGGQGYKAGLKGLVKATDPAEVAEVLKDTYKLADEQIDEIAETIAKSTDEAEIDELLQANLKRTELADDAVAETVEEVPEIATDVVDDITEEVTTDVADDVVEEVITEAPKAVEVEEAVRPLTERRLEVADELGLTPDEFAKSITERGRGVIKNEDLYKLAEDKPADFAKLLRTPAKDMPVGAEYNLAYRASLRQYDRDVIQVLELNLKENPGDIRLQEELELARKNYEDASSAAEALATEGGRLVQSMQMTHYPELNQQLNRTIKGVRDNIKQRKPEMLANFDRMIDRDLGRNLSATGLSTEDASALLAKLAKWNESGFLEKLAEFQKTMLLSSPSTHILNVSGNLLQQAIDIPNRALAGTLDWVRSAKNKEPRTVYAQESVELVKGTVEALPEAIIQFGKAMMDENYGNAMNKVAIEQGISVPSIKSTVFGKVPRILSFRALQATDLFTRVLKDKAETRALAFRLAKLEGLKGKELKARAKELAEALPKETRELVDAKVNRSLLLEDLGAITGKLENLKNEYPVIQLFMPFYRTLVNLTREAYRLTPLGGVVRGGAKTVGTILNNKGIKEFGQTKWTRGDMGDGARVEELSRQAMGTAVMAYLVGKIVDGEIEVTGQPRNDSEKEKLYGQGKLPNSIRIGDSWYDLSRIQPASQLLIWSNNIADMVKAYKNQDGLTAEQVRDQIGEALGETLKFFVEQAPFQGVSDLYNFVSGGKYNEGVVEAGPKYFSQLARTFIPNILRRTSSSMNPQIYEKENFGDQVRSAIPGAQGGLVPKRDITGEPAQRTGSFWELMLSPIRRSEQSNDPVFDEMDRVGFDPTVPTRNVSGYSLSAEEYETLLLDYGPRMRRELLKVMETPNYQNSNDAVKRQYLDRIESALLRDTRGRLFSLYQANKKLYDAYIKSGYSPQMAKQMADQQVPIDFQSQYAQNQLEQAQAEGKTPSTISELLAQ